MRKSKRSAPSLTIEELLGGQAVSQAMAEAPSSTDVLTAILRAGAQDLLAKAIQAEVDQWLAERSELAEPGGRRAVVRNGYLPARSVLTGIGPVEVTVPRVHDRREADEREKFTSAILPPYVRQAPSVSNVLPWLYLKGVSSGQMGEALAALLGPSASGLSANVIMRLKQQWMDEYQAWSSRSLEGKHYVYVWADGIYFNIRLAEPGNSRQCLLVLMGATESGIKELIAIVDGYRESEQSWYELLTDGKVRGLTIEPKLAIGDGALGFWTALAKAYPTTKVQRCWVHKEANVLNKLPKGVQAKATSMLKAIWMAETRSAAEQAMDQFVAAFSAKYPKAAECLTKDRAALLAFYDFPAEHWASIRTSNPIESTFSTVRLRTDKTKGCGTRLACLAMVFKLGQSAEKSWRALNGCKLLADVIAGVTFVDGVKQIAA
jgi:putative transposase